MHVLNSSYILARVRRLTGGSASPHLNVGEVRVFPIPFPPAEEQEEIVAEVERRLSIADEVELLIETSRKRSTRLRQSILRRAFEGKLVSQHLTDEPASKLLERILSHRDKLSGHGQTSRELHRRRCSTKQTREGDSANG